MPIEAKIYNVPIEANFSLLRQRLVRRISLLRQKKPIEAIGPRGVGAPLEPKPGRRWAPLEAYAGRRRRDRPQSTVNWGVYS